MSEHVLSHGAGEGFWGVGFAAGCVRIQSMTWNWGFLDMLSAGRVVVSGC